MATNGHMEWFEQMDLKEQQNIINSVNHIGRIVKRYAFCNIGLCAKGAKAVGMPNYLQLGNCLQFSTLFGHIWDNWGNYRGNLRHLLGILWHFKENYRQLWHVWGNLSRFPCCISFIFVTLIFVMKYSRRWRLHIGPAKSLNHHFG